MHHKGKHSLSLCMIVKNEAETLEQCLRLARPHVDEIVVVDTGSTDGSQAIARRYADVYDEIEWPNSFSLARNHSLDLASGDYLLILDGDEYIPDPLHWKRLRKALRQHDLAVIQLPVRNLLPDDQILGADRMWQERVLRNHPQIRYSGRVHNQVQDALLEHMQATGHRLIQVKAEIIHTGYALSPERMKDKYRPRLHLLRAEYEQPRSAEHRAYYGYQLGLAYFILHEHNDAAAVFNALDYRLLIPQNAFYTRVLAAQTGLALHDVPMALHHCNEMFSLDRTEPIAYYTTGLALLQNRQVGDGLLMLLEAFDRNEQDQGSIRFILNPQQLLHVLVQVCERVGLQKQAAAFRALTAQDRYDARLVRSMIHTLRTSIVLAEARAA